MNTLNILLAEDNLADILLVRKALNEHEIPYDLHVVRDGEEALAFIEGMGEPGSIPCPDIVLLDVNLPKVEGAEILSQFRKHPQCADTPVIVITSSDARGDRDRMAQLGIARYFKKPSDLDAFLKLGAVVREVVEGTAPK
jgi:chemotaxis family two-component system response regulator Rcp1